ncbi:MAG: M20/M25/M40 family metallo-hydrolase, partial [Candidatus Micrarchaeia archaeon]
IPGTDVSFMDCRVLPDYALDDVLSYVNSIAAGYAKYGVKVEIEPYSRDDAARPTDMNSELVKLLAAKIYKLRGVKIAPVGIGGGTVARYFREEGMQTVVWSTLEDVAHEPNEYAIIENMVNDAKVFSNLYV